MYDADTIAAISTSLGNSGIHIIRIIGNQSFEVINRIFKKEKKCVILMLQYQSHILFIMDI